MPVEMHIEQHISSGKVCVGEIGREDERALDRRSLFGVRLLRRRALQVSFTEDVPGSRRSRTVPGALLLEKDDLSVALGYICKAMDDLAIFAAALRASRDKTAQIIGGRLAPGGLETYNDLDLAREIVADFAKETQPG
jgi:hypothetical protein